MLAPKPAAEKSNGMDRTRETLRNGFKKGTGVGTAAVGLAVAFWVALSRLGEAARFMLSFGGNTAFVRLGVTGGLVPEDGVPERLDELEDKADA